MSDIQAMVMKERIELHLRTGYSNTDGLTKIQQAVRRAAALGCPAIAVTDYGSVQAFPEAQKAGREYHIKVIYGLEADICSDTEQPSPIRAYRAVLLARNKAGLKNLYALISSRQAPGEDKGFVISRRALEAHRSGLLIGSAGVSGAVGQAILHGESQDKINEIASQYDYIEIQPDCSGVLCGVFDAAAIESLRQVNIRMVQAAKAAGKIIVAAGDVRFLEPQDELAWRVLLSARGIRCPDTACPLYFKTTHEMLVEFAYLGVAEAYTAVVANPYQIAGRIDAIEPIPPGTFYPVLGDAEAEIERESIACAESIYGSPLPEAVKKRLEWELAAICKNNFAAAFSIAQRLARRSRENGYLVGSRACLASSLVAYLIGITELNPLPPHYVCRHCLHSDFCVDSACGAGIELPDRHCPVCGETMRKDGFDIPAETLLGINGDKPPEIALNFAKAYQASAASHLQGMFGREHVFACGSINTICEESAGTYIENYIKETGKALPQEDIERITRMLSGVKHKLMPHPSGYFIIPADMNVHNFCPAEMCGDHMTMQFSAFYLFNTLLKVDLCGHDAPAMLYALQGATGIDPSAIPLDDKDTMLMLQSANTKGVPEYKTGFMREVISKVKPACLSDLIKVYGLVHGAGTWAGNADQLLENGTAALGDVAALRDDIFHTLVRKKMPREDAYRTMEIVRTGRFYAGPGSHQDEANVQRRIICESSMHQYGVPDWYIDALKKIKYLFPKAHAAAHTLMYYRIAWYKAHFPREFDAVISSQKEND